MKIKLNKEQVAYLSGLDTPEAKKDFLMNCFLHQCEEKLKEEESQPIIFKDGLFKTSDPEIIEWLKNFDKGFFIKNNDIVSDEFKQPIPKIKITPDVIKSFEKAYDSDEIFWGTKDEPKNYTIGEIVDKVTKLSVEKVEQENLLKFDLPKQESLSKEQLKDITKPKTIVYEFDGRKLSDKDFFEEVDKAKRYFDFNLLKEFTEYQPPHPDKVKKYTKEDMEKCFNESRRYRIEPPNPRSKFWNSFEEYMKINH